MDKDHVRNACTHFGELPIGTGFEYFEKRYRKVALSMATGEDGCSNVFMGETPVTVEGELAERLGWKPDPVYWADRLAPAPGSGIVRPLFHAQ